MIGRIGAYPSTRLGSARSLAGTSTVRFAPASSTSNLTVPADPASFRASKAFSQVGVGTPLIERTVSPAFRGLVVASEGAAEGFVLGGRSVTWTGASRYAGY